MTNRNVSILSIILLLVTILSIVNVAFYNFVLSNALLINLAFVVLSFIFLKKIDITALVLFFVLFVFIFLIVVFNDGGVGSVLTFTTPLLLAYIFSKVDFSPSQRRFLSFVLCLLLFLILLRSTLFRNDWVFYRDNQINPNVYGYFTIQIFILWLLLYKGQYKRIFSCVLLLVTIMSLVFLKSRGVLVSLLFFTFLYFLFGLKLKKYVIPILIAIIIIGGFVFPFVYMNLYQSGYSLTFLGKTLYTGREDIWGEALFMLKNNTQMLFFGLGSHSFEGAANLHNNFLAFLVNFGLLATFLYYLFIFSCLCLVSRYIKEKKVRLLLAWFIATTLFLGYTEITTLWPLAFFFPSFTLGQCILRIQNKPVEVENQMFLRSATQCQ